MPDYPNGRHVERDVRLFRRYRSRYNFTEDPLDRFPFCGTFYLDDGDRESMVSFALNPNWVFLFTIAINDLLDVNRGISQ